MRALEQRIKAVKAANDHTNESKRERLFHEKQGREAVPGPLDPVVADCQRECTWSFSTTPYALGYQMQRR